VASELIVEVGFEKFDFEKVKLEARKIPLLKR
jgi:hypothetical protein